MRLIGQLPDEAQALRISSVLLAEGIDNQVEPEEGTAPAWAVWVHAEEDLERAAGIFAAFRANPHDPLFAPLPPARGVAAARRNETSQPGAGGASRPADPSRGARPDRPRRAPVRPGRGEVTVLVLIVCVAIGVVTRLTDTHPVVGQLQISQEWFNYRSSWTAFLPEVRAGQVWRLFTPALLHFGWPHLLFNLWTFWDLGRAIEWRRGSGTLLGLILGLGVISNLGQYLYTGPHFGGLSGAIYGLLGYVWMLGKFRPSAGLALHPQMVVMMLVWFVICLSGALRVPVANTAHGVGLLAGMGWGWIAARSRN
jgi:GlpG protein